MAGIRYKGQIFSGAASFGDADHVAYDNTESGLTATDVQGALDEVNTSLNGSVSSLINSINNMFVVEGKSSATVSLGANGFGDATADISKSGYSPLGVVGFQSFSVSVVPYNLRITSATTVSAGLRNVAASAQSGVYNFYILYKKNL